MTKRAETTRCVEDCPIHEGWVPVFNVCANCNYYRGWMSDGTNDIICVHPDRHDREGPEVRT